MANSLKRKYSRPTFMVFALVLAFLTTGRVLASPLQVAVAQLAVGDSAAVDSANAVAATAIPPRPATGTEVMVSDGLAAEIDTLYHDLQVLESRVLDIKSRMLQFSSALERKERLLTGRESEVSSRADQLAALEEELSGRERNMNLLKYFSLAGLLVALILFVTGYFTLRAGKKRLRQANAERQAGQSQNESTSVTRESEVSSPAGD